MPPEPPDPRAIISRFQSRRRLSRAIRFWTMVVGIGGIVGALLRLRSLHDLKEPPYALFAFFLAACAVWVLGALIHPVIYRCPSCHRRVAVPDPTESGTILLEDPDQCPHCHARLRG